MADALCGPSNPLQSFQKHATVDRTLQQDRLRSAASPAQQGFRSFDPRQGSLDNEFAAFEAGQPFQSLSQQPLPFNAVRPGHRPSVPVQSLAGGSASWANDFQKLRLSGPSQPIPQSQFRTEAPLHRSQPGPSGWHAEFMRNQRGRQATPDLAPQQSYMNGQYSFANTVPTAFNGYDVPQFAQAEQLQSHPVEMQREPMDDAAFDEAFARMESEHLDRLEGLKKELEDQIRHPVDEQSETIRIGSDLIEERKPPENEHQERADADELARTAGDLLNALKHDQSDKFQQSQFLSFMRRIRDREVEVKGEDFVETTYQTSLHPEQVDHQQPLHPGGRYYPERSPPVVEEHTSMSGAISGSDLDQFDQVAESHSPASHFPPRDINIQGVAYRQEGQSTA